MRNNKLQDDGLLSDSESSEDSSSESDEKITELKERFGEIDSEIKAINNNIVLNLNKIAEQLSESERKELSQFILGLKENPNLHHESRNKLLLARLASSVSSELEISDKIRKDTTHTYDTVEYDASLGKEFKNKLSLNEETKVLTSDVSISNLEIIKDKLDIVGKPLFRERVACVELEGKLKTSSVVAVTGVAGSGKTWLATYTINKFKEEKHFNLTYKLECDNLIEFVQSYIELAKELSSNEHIKRFCKSNGLLEIYLNIRRVNPGSECSKKFIKQLLNIIEIKFILLFDNLNDKKIKDIIINEYFPKTSIEKNKLIVITTQDKRFYSDKKKIMDIGTLEKKVAMSLLEDIVIDSKTIDSIILKFDSIPLGIISARYFLLYNTFIDATEYLRILDSENKEMVNLRSAQERDFLMGLYDKNKVNRSLQSAIQLSIKRSEGKEILSVCSFLSADYIPINILKEYFKIATLKGEPRKVPDSSEGIVLMKLSVEIKKLENYSLLKRCASDSISLHRVVQHVNLQSLSVDESKLYLKNLLLVFKNIFIFDPTNSCLWEKCNLYLPHIINVLDHVEKLSLKDYKFKYKFIKMMQQIAYYILIVQRDPKSALDLFKKAEKILIKLDKENSLDYAILLNEQAHAYHKMCNYRESKKLFLRSLEIKEKIKAPVLEIVMNLLALGNITQHMKEFEESLNYYRQAETFYVEEKQKIAVILTCIADVYLKKMDYRNALSTLEQAWGKLDKYSEHKPHIAKTAILHLKGCILWSQGKCEEGLNFFEKAMINDKNCYGEGSFEAKFCGYILGKAMLFTDGKFGEGISYLKKIHSQASKEDDVTYDIVHKIDNLLSQYDKKDFRMKKDARISLSIFKDDLDENILVNQVTSSTTGNPRFEFHFFSC